MAQPFSAPDGTAAFVAAPSYSLNSLLLWQLAPNSCAASFMLFHFQFQNVCQQIFLCEGGTRQDVAGLRNGLYSWNMDVHSSLAEPIIFFAIWRDQCFFVIVFLINWCSCKLKETQKQKHWTQFCSTARFLAIRRLIFVSSM
jgi:hypothetical protein